MNRIGISGLGFTLVELLMAMVILSIAILGVWSLHVSTINNDNFANRIVEATALANEKAEELKSDDYSNLTNGTSDETVQPATAERNYRRRWKIDDATAPETKQVSVTVGWEGTNCLNNIDECKHKVKIITFVSKL